MINSNIPLFKDFESYSRSLPVRRYIHKSGEFKEYIALNTLNYYVDPDDLTKMVNKINDIIVPSRGDIVKYVSAPTANGKTASVLPAFLRSTEMNVKGTHYLYIAFNNNNERSFSSIPYIPSSDLKVAEKQGAAFMVECVKTLLERPDDEKAYEINIEAPEKVPSRKDSKNNLNEYLDEKLGKDYRIWFHLDEHGKMCDRSVGSKGDGAAFSRGAMGLLASLPKAVVIATYVEKPNIPDITSSDVCRYPIALPSLDINQVLKKVPELSLESLEITDRDEKRMLASLKFRLGFKIKEKGIISILHRRGTCDQTEDFLKQFRDAVKENGIIIIIIIILLLLSLLLLLLLVTATEILRKCNKLCGDVEMKKKGKSSKDDDATALLLGIEDSDEYDRQFQNVFSLSDDRLTVSIERLLSIVDPNIKVYETGRDLFKKRLSSPDLISSTPLEASYFWTLSCASASKDEIEFMLNVKYNIRCKQLLKKRLFPYMDSSVYNLSSLNSSTIYYADENNNGKLSHPLADLFFVSDNNELVINYYYYYYYY